MECWATTYWTANSPTSVIAQGLCRLAPTGIGAKQQRIDLLRPAFESPVDAPPPGLDDLQHCVGGLLIGTPFDR
jgi:hypothetical protein